MSDRCFVATRKGFFTIERNAGGWEVTKADFLGQNANMLMHDPRDQSLFVAFDHGHFGVKLHRSTNGGESWDECGVPVFPEWTDEDQQKQDASGEWGARRDFSSLAEIWELTPGGADQPGTLWAGTIPGGLFKSTDHGESWQLVESLWNREERWQWFGGGKDSPGIHSVSVHPNDSNNVYIGISCGGVWATFDGGENWEVRSHGMRAEFMPPDQQGDPNVQDPHRTVRCQSHPDHMWAQHHNGIFRTTNGGELWTEITEVNPLVFGFAVIVHPHDPNIAWFVPGVKDECRIPPEGRFVVTRTKDGGESFEVLTEGLPQQHAYDIVFRHAMDIDATGERLVMGSSTGSLWISKNGGDSWETVSTHLPPIYCTRFASE